MAGLLLDRAVLPWSSGLQTDTCSPTPSDPWHWAVSIGATRLEEPYQTTAFNSSNLDLKKEKNTSLLN